MILTLYRSYLPHCVVGELYAGEKRFFSIERPWESNKPFVSCIPEGVYALSPWTSKKFRTAWHLKDVPERTDILIHAGNTVADVQGCIAIGMTFDFKNMAVRQSRVAMEKLTHIIKQNKIDRIRITVNHPQYP